MANEHLLNEDDCPKCQAKWAFVDVVTNKRQTRLLSVMDRKFNRVASYVCPDCGYVWLRTGTRFV